MKTSISDTTKVQKDFTYLGTYAFFQEEICNFVEIHKIVHNHEEVMSRKGLWHKNCLEPTCRFLHISCLPYGAEEEIR